MTKDKVRKTRVCLFPRKINWKPKSSCIIPGKTSHEFLLLLPLSFTTRLLGNQTEVEIPSIEFKETNKKSKSMKIQYLRCRQGRSVSRIWQLKGSGTKKKKRKEKRKRRNPQREKEDEEGRFEGGRKQKEGGGDSCGNGAEIYIVVATFV